MEKKPHFIAFCLLVGLLRHGQSRGCLEAIGFCVLSFVGRPRRQGKQGGGHQRDGRHDAALRTGSSHWSSTTAVHGALERHHMLGTRTAERDQRLLTGTHTGRQRSQG